MDLLYVVVAAILVLAVVLALGYARRPPEHHHTPTRPHLTHPHEGSGHPPGAAKPGSGSMPRHA